MSEASQRNDDSGLWFSPQPPAPTGPAVQGARSPDSVLFDLGAIASTPPRAQPKLRLATTPRDASSSGVIDLATVAAACRDPHASSAPVASVAMAPSLVTVVRAPSAPAPAPAAAPRPVLFAIVGLLVALLGLLVVLARG